MINFFIKTTLILLSFVNLASASEKLLITVNQYVNHTSLNSAYFGLIESLKSRGIIPNKAELVSSNAQGSISNSVQISKYHASLSPDFMVAIATPAVQTNVKAQKNKKSIVAFLAVTDPSAANLTSVKNIIGVSDNPPIDELIDIIASIFPNLKSIGIIFNPGEINSIKILEKLERVLSRLGIRIQKVSISNASNIKTAMNKLVSSVDLIYLPQDNLVASALDNISSIAKINKVLLISNDPALVQKGVGISLGSDYFLCGKKLGNMIADLIEGVEIQENIQNIENRELKINRDILKEFSIKVPDNLGEKI